MNGIMRKVANNKVEKKKKITRILILSNLTVMENVSGKPYEDN